MADKQKVVEKLNVYYHVISNKDKILIADEISHCDAWKRADQVFKDFGYSSTICFDSKEDFENYLKKYG